jgi:hypothetical protein
VEVKMNDKISERREGKRPSVKDLAAQLSATTSADLLLYAGPISMHGFVHLERCCKSRAVKRRNVVLFLSTYGGDTHAAYRIARCMGQHYTKFTILVHSVCKSAPVGVPREAGEGDPSAIAGTTLKGSPARA